MEQHLRKTIQVCETGSFVNDNIKMHQTRREHETCSMHQHTILRMALQSSSLSAKLDGYLDDIAGGEIAARWCAADAMVQAHESLISTGLPRGRFEPEVISHGGM